MLFFGFVSFLKRKEEVFVVGAIFFGFVSYEKERKIRFLCG